jgi:hypothetical protein
LLKLTYSRPLQLVESIFDLFQLNYNLLNIRIEPTSGYFMEMNAVLPNELLISQQTCDLGNQLIKEMNINRGYGMANFFDFNSCYDNHQAVLIWAFQLLEREPTLNEFAEIKKYFLLFFPDSAYQLA